MEAMKELLPKEKSLGWLRSFSLRASLDKRGAWRDMGVSLPLRKVARSPGRGRPLFDRVLAATVTAPAVAAVMLAKLWGELDRPERQAGGICVAVVVVGALALLIKIYTWKSVFEITDQTVRFEESDWFHREVASERPLSEFKAIAIGSVAARNWWGGRAAIYQISLQHGSDSAGYMLLYCGTDQAKFFERLELYPRLLRKPLLEKEPHFHS